MDVRDPVLAGFGAPGTVGPEVVPIPSPCGPEPNCSSRGLREKSVVYSQLEYPDGGHSSCTGNGLGYVWRGWGLGTTEGRE